MLPAILALVGAAAYGSGDFLGGLAAKRLRSIVVTAVSGVVGGTVLLAFYPLLGGTWSVEAVLWGAVAGVFGAASVGLLYACLAIGPMSILSPVTALVSAITPLVWGLVFGGERLQIPGYVGLAVAVVGVILIGFVPGEQIVRPTLRAIMMAIGSGVSIGAFLICLDQTSHDSGIVPLIANRGVSVLVTGGIVVGLLIAGVRRGKSAQSALAAPQVTTATPTAAGGEGETASGGGTPDSAPATAAATTSHTWHGWALASGAGLANTTANLLILFALRVADDIGVVSVLAALYPIGTIVLAAVILHERIALIQWTGLALALLAAALFALP